MISLQPSKHVKYSEVIDFSCIIKVSPTQRIKDPDGVTKTLCSISQSLLDLYDARIEVREILTCNTGVLLLFPPCLSVPTGRLVERGEVLLLPPPSNGCSSAVIDI